MDPDVEKALKAMSLVEEEPPFVLLDLPEYFAYERNSLSIIGRTLNPLYQPMENLILDMQRKFRVNNRVRGIALSRERFQFIFNYKEDMDDVLTKGAWTYNEWSLVIDKWYETEPEDYLKFMSVWVQIRNIPVNYHTPDAIFRLGGILGEVKEIAFDPKASQRKDYVRVRVLFDVNQPVRRYRVVTFPKGEEVKLLFDFERVQKCCYICQRLTHDKAHCPLLLQIQRDAMVTKETEAANLPRDAQIITPSDPLWGVLSEEQVGRDPLTGKRKIVDAVLNEMRQYLVADGEKERKARVLRVQSTVAEAERDPFAQSSLLRLESMPLVHTNVDKGKGIVFSYEEIDKTTVSTRQEDKLMSSSMRSNLTRLNEPRGDILQAAANSLKEHKKNRVGSTVYRESLGASSSGTKAMSSSRRKRPPRNKRQAAESLSNTA